MKLKSWLKNIISKEPLKVIIYYYKNISILFFHAVSLMEKLSKPLLRTWKWFYFKILQIYLNYLSFSLCPPTPKAQQLKKEYKTLSQGSVQSVQFRCSVVSDSLRPHESQHARPPCPSPTPRVHQNPHPSSRWCHPAISSSVVPFSSWPQSLPASESFPMSQLFTSGGQSTGVSALASSLQRTPRTDLL